MFCHRCGKALPEAANFCPSCGAPANANVFAASPLNTIYRPRMHRMIAGVCAGLALRYGWDLTATRIIAVLLGILVFPVGEIAYVVAWLLIPEEIPLVPQAPFVAPPVASQPPSNPPAY